MAFSFSTPEVLALAMTARQERLFIVVFTPILLIFAFRGLWLAWKAMNKSRQ